VSSNRHPPFFFICFLKVPLSDPMSKIARVVIAVLFAGVLFGCQQSPQEPQEQKSAQQEASPPPAKQDQPPTAKVLLKDAASVVQYAPDVLLGEGEPRLLYFAKDGRVTFQEGETALPLDGEVPKKGGQLAHLVDIDGALLAFWWNKLDNSDKHLYMRRSVDGGRSFEPLQQIDSGNGILDYRVAHHGEKVAVLYYDERGNENVRGAGYKVYVNVSQDGGQHWLAQDVQLDALSWRSGEVPFSVEPEIVFLGDTIVVAWKERHQDPADEKQRTYRVMVSSSADGGHSWSAPTVVKESDKGFMLAMSLLSHEGALWIVGYQTAEGLVGYRSTDGVQWSALGLHPASSPRQIMSQIVVAPVKGGLSLVYTLDEERRRAKVYATSYIQGEGWVPEPVRIDRKEGEDTFISRNPTLLSLGENVVLAAWEDYRHIRPSTYLNLSTDGGKTWLDAARPAVPAGGVRDTFPKLKKGTGQKLGLVVQRYEDEADRQADMVYIELPTDASGRLALDRLAPDAAVDVAAREARLRERVKQFWDLRVAGKHADTYAFFDKAFRAKTTEATYAAGQGNIIYHSYELKKVVIRGELALVMLNAEFEVPKMDIGTGEPVTIERQSRDASANWLWLDGDWYLSPDKSGKLSVEF